MNAIMPRDTIEQIVSYRNKALELYEIAYDRIVEAHEAVKAAHEMERRAHPGINNYNYAQAEEVKAFHRAVVPPQRAQYLRTARRLADIDVWAWVIERTDLERLMDSEAKKKLRAQLAYVPEQWNYDRNGDCKALINEEEIERGIPEVSVENIVATIEKFAGEADMIFRRGIANVFSSLDRRFRSHDGFKIGSRLIITYMFDSSGRLGYGRTRDQLIDVERVFSILDGRPEASFTSALYSLDRDRSGYTPTQSLTETEYFRIRGFKNGNAHLWFQRDDLVEKVNKLLAEHYGEVIGDGQTQEEDVFENIKTTPAKRYGFYPTPEPAADRVIGCAQLLQRSSEPRLTILEPSAGTGNLARRCVKTIEAMDNWAGGRERYAKEYRFDNAVDCVEIQPTYAAALTDEGIYRRVICQDFLHLQPASTGLYDRIVMNPPFDRERDIDHVVHALKFLKPSGLLVAIMSAGTEFRETRKSIAFRALMEEMKAKWEDLPAGSFAESGTYINTLTVKVWKDGRAHSRW